MDRSAPVGGATRDPLAADVVITACLDGPLLVRGPVEIIDADGSPIEPGRSTVALCRCGRSRRKPFCDGSHVLARFRSTEDPRPSQPQPAPALGVVPQAAPALGLVQPASSRSASRASTARHAEAPHSTAASCP